MSVSKLLALLLLLSVALCVVVRAQEEAEDAAAGADEDFDATSDDDASDRVTGMTARTFFLGQDPTVAPTFPAGEKVVAHVALSSEAKNPAYTVFFLNGFVSRLGDFNNAIQNFSGTRHNVVVQGGETATFTYTFQPDKMLEPQDYNLVIRLFFSTDANKTFAAVGFNSSITVSDPLGADPKTFATFATIAAIIGAAAYAVNLRRKKTYKPRPRASTETGTKDNTYDPAYISEEHTRFRDAILRKATPSPSKKK
jgi:translocon-associated protein subunit alpha